MTAKISSILKDTNYNLSIFDETEIKSLESQIKLKKGKPYINCIIRDKEVQLKPEEVVRQLYTMKLINDYAYPKKRIRFEHPVQFGRETKAADIVIFDKDRPTVEYIIGEVKKPKLKDGKDQLKSYCNATGAPIGIWTNGGQISRLLDFRYTAQKIRGKHTGWRMSYIKFMALKLGGISWALFWIQTLTLAIGIYYLLNSLLTVYGSKLQL
jgi:hypothetical protein